MAESAVKSAADWLGALLIEEGKLLLGAEDKVRELRDELLWLQSFLRDADTIQCDDEIVRLWVFQIKEYVSEAEDIIDDFVIKVVSCRRQTSNCNWVNKVKRFPCIPREWYARRRAASSIGSLKMKISMLSPRLKEYGLQTSYGLKTYQAQEARNEQVQQSLKYVHVEEKMITGMEKNSKEIMVALKDSTRTHGVVAIHGMGGLGKTTLASTVFYNKEMRQHFRGGCAWVYVSKQFHLKSVLEQILASLTSSTTYNDFSEPMLVHEVVGLLEEKRCLVVLDDIWSKEAWGLLKPAFTSCGGGSGSKVLITTRKEEVAKDADPKSLEKPDGLDDNDGWELLRKTLGWKRTDRNENVSAKKMIPAPPIDTLKAPISGNKKAGTTEGNGHLLTTQTGTTKGSDGCVVSSHAAEKTSTGIGEGQDAKTRTRGSEGHAISIQANDRHARAQKGSVEGSDWHTSAQTRKINMGAGHEEHASPKTGMSGGSSKGHEINIENGTIDGNRVGNVNVEGNVDDEHTSAQTRKIDIGGGNEEHSSPKIGMGGGSSEGHEISIGNGTINANRVGTGSVEGNVDDGHTRAQTRKINLGGGSEEHTSPKTGTGGGIGGGNDEYACTGTQKCNSSDGRASVQTRTLTRGDDGQANGQSNDGKPTTSSNDEVFKKRELGEKMLKYCKGLPLAIVVLGGILRKKETLDEWETVHKNISSYLRRGYNRGRSYEEVLVQSYIDLPYHLKPCFLHLAHFPEDYEIYTERLYWMWIAEGLVTWSRNRIAGTDETLEDVANEYLYDLAQAGMVKIVKQTSNGRIKSIRVHDLMRDVCLQRATTENFLNIIDHRHCLDKPLNICSYFSHKRLLRLAIYLADGVNSFIPDSVSTEAYKHLRSLFFIGGHELAAEKDKCAEWMRRICKEFQWLRVLDLEGLCLQGRLAKEVRNLVHLRYLSLKDTKVSEVPSFVGNLRFLQILDLRISATVASVTLANTLWKLDQLRHLLLPKQSYGIVGSTTLRVDTLLCLERLENLEVGKFDPKELLKLRNLRRVFVKDNISKECLNLILQSPALKSGYLRSCSFGVEGSVLSDRRRILPRLGCIHRLKMVEQITGRIENDVFPRSLRNLHLECCKLENDPMEILGSLGHLKQLSLGMDSFVGREITCKPGSFLRLTTLNLQGLRNLQSWKLEEGSMSKLKKLTIKRCDRLEKIPEGLPLFVEVTCWPCVGGSEKYANCVCCKAVSLPVGSYQRHFITLPMSLLQLSLMEGRYKKVVLFGQGETEQTTHVETLYHSGAIRLLFDAIARASPRTICGTDSFPRRELEGLLRDLNPGVRREMSYLELIQEIQLVMHEKKCLVILTDVENVGPHDIDYLDTVFGSHGFGEGSKLLITSKSDEMLFKVEKGDEMLQSRDNELFLHLSQLAPKYLSLAKKRLPPPPTLENKVPVGDLLERALMEGKYKKVVLLGQGGIGKTTHVKALYHSGVIHQRFDAIAWASPPRKCGTTIRFPRRVLEGLLRDLNPGIGKEGLSQMSSSELNQEIQLVMQKKKCLVILVNFKDVDHHDLDYLDTTFRSQGYEEGSKLLITSTSDKILGSRDNELFLHLCDDHFSFQLAPKNWSLVKSRLPPLALENKVSRISMGMGMAKCWPAHPLSLVMLGGLLAMKDSLKEWETISSLKMQELPQIFKLCYDHMPDYLRHCLLSLSNFPEDAEIPTKKLYRLWIAAGFERFKDDIDHSGESLESNAETYLNELVQRGFVKVGKRRPNGKIKTCRLQFALQDLCIDKAKEENFLAIVHPSESSTSASNHNSATQHLTIHLNTLSTSNQELCSLINSFNSLNSLLFSPNVVDPLLRIKSWDWFIKICNQFHSLRILDLEGMWMTKGSLPEEVGNLVNLSFLSLKGTWVGQLPLSICKLTNLQTLDLRVLKSIIIPNILWKFKNMRHLYLPALNARQRAKLRLCGLDHLQTLVNLQTDRVHLSHLLKLKCVKKVSIRKIHFHGMKELDGVLNFLGRSLELTIDSVVVNANPNVLSSLQNLQRLKIKGRISVALCPEMFPPNLEELTLKHTKLEQDSIPVLEKLPQLVSLHFGHDSFLGKRMTFSGEFHALRHLKVCSLSNLESLDKNPENDMCNLESIVIRDCWRLQVNLPVKDPLQKTLDI